jgi:lysozyme family protein
MSAFDKAFDYVVGREGVYDDDPEDHGNWTGGKKGVGVLKGTKYGISAAAYPDFDIENLTLEMAKQIYRADYWDKAQCDNWAPALALCVFDCAVNQGVGRALRCLQRAAGVNDDGKIGPHTRAAVARLDPATAIEYFQAERILEYVQAATWERFKRGWMRRVIGTAMVSTR